MKKNLSQIGWLMTGMIVCLTMSSCTTFRNTENADEDLYGANTQENQNKTHVDKPFALDVLIQMDVQFVAFRMKDVEKLYLAGNMTKEGLFRLWQAGKAKLVSSASGVGLFDQELILKSVHEMIYPSEFNVTTNGIIEPQNFTMRETGVILQVIPKFDERDQTITMTLRPQLVTLERWESCPTEIGSRWNRKTLPFPQPIFACTSFETNLTMSEGETVLIGSTSMPDGEWVNAGFLTVRRLGAKSQK